METMEVAGLGQDGHRDDRADSRYLTQALVVGIIRQRRMGPLFDAISLADQASPLRDD